MIRILGVRFRKSNKIYYFDPEDREIKKGSHVIVETARGMEYGTVILPPEDMPEEKVPSPLKPIIRCATEEDDRTNANNIIDEAEAYQICQEKIQAHGLKMKLVDSEYTFNRNKLLFYFTADGRIDFRELVKDLASVFRTRIELRQIGVRDETKLLGGIAMCGRPLCCHSYLSEFSPVSIKMAKEQGLSLNPTQISGICGRLMCCLKNEEEAYEYLNRSLPAVGSRVKTADGYVGEVKDTNTLKQRVKVLIHKGNDEKELREYPVAELSFNGKRDSIEAWESGISLEEMADPNELKALKLMEQEDQKELEEDIVNAEEDRAPEQRNNRSRRQRPDKKDRSQGNRQRSRDENSRKNQPKADRRNPNRSERQDSNRSVQRDFNHSTQKELNRSAQKDASNSGRRKPVHGRNKTNHPENGDQNSNRRPQAAALEREPRIKYDRQDRPPKTEHEPLPPRREHPPYARGGYSSGYEPTKTEMRYDQKHEGIRNKKPQEGSRSRRYNSGHRRSENRTQDN